MCVRMYVKIRFPLKTPMNRMPPSIVRFQKRILSGGGEHLCKATHPHLVTLLPPTNIVFVLQNREIASVPHTIEGLDIGEEDTVKTHSVPTMKLDEISSIFVAVWAVNKVKETKEMFHLTTHSIHFYLRLYGVRHMVKNHSDSERGNPLQPHRLLLPISRITHTTAFVTPVVWHRLEREIAQWVHHEGSTRRPIGP